MKRISTDAEYLDSGKLVIDADGIPLEPASKDYADSKAWVRRNILNGEDLNDLTETGLYLITLSNTMASLLNRPFGSTGPGFLVVTNSDGTIIQELTNYSNDVPITMSRTTRGGVFQDWVNPATVTKPFLWADMNDAVIEGDYDLSVYATVRDLVNRPPFVTIPASAHVTVRRAGGSRLIQSIVGIVTGGIGERWERNRNSTGSWEAWERIFTDESPTAIDTSHVVTVGDSQVGATYAWANLLESVSDLTVVNRGESAMTPDEALLRTGGRSLKIAPITLQPGVRTAVTLLESPMPVIRRDFSQNGWVNGKRVSIWYTHATGGWEAILTADESEPLTLSAPGVWRSVWGTYEPELDARRIVWFGGNAIRTGSHGEGETLASHVMRAYSRAIDAWGDTTIVCGYVPAYGDGTGRDAADALNRWLADTVPTQFLDMRYRIQQAAPDILGRALTTSEQQDIANGYLPRPLYRSDLVHLTDEAHVKIAEIVAEFTSGASPSLAIQSRPVSIQELSGTGSPEGKITAAAGSAYTDTAATNGAIRWVKTSGTGNTGWKVEYGDTGWRDITSLITSSPAIVMGTGARLAIRRTGGSVFFRAVGPITMGGQFGNIVAAHPGIRPDLDTNTSASRGAAFRNTRSWIRLEDGTRDAVLAESGRAVEVIWSTTEAWPSSLPGTPV